MALIFTWCSSLWDDKGRPTFVWATKDGAYDLTEAMVDDECEIRLWSFVFRLACLGRHHIIAGTSAQLEELGELLLLPVGANIDIGVVWNVMLCDWTERRPP